MKKKKIIEYYERKVDDFIKFINYRKRESSKILQLKNTGPDDWKKETTKILENFKEKETD